MVKRFLHFYLKQDIFLFWSTTLSFLLGLFLIGFWFISLPWLPNQIPLFYSLSWGEAQLVNKSQLILIPLIIFLITFTNLIISWHLHPTQQIVKRVIASFTLLFTLLLTITGLKIVDIFI